jgi:hypothetical protein
VAGSIRAGPRERSAPPPLRLIRPAQLIPHLALIDQVDEESGAGRVRKGPLPRAPVRAGHHRCTEASDRRISLAVIRYAKLHGTKHRPWLTALLARRPTKIAAIALANKMARMAWAMMTRGEHYKEPVALAA